MNEKEIVRYAFLSDFVRSSTNEEIVRKLIELDEKHKKLDEECYREKSLKELYKDRIDKAISFINGKSFRDDINFPNAYGLGISSTNELLEILEGVKDDV